LYDRPTRRRRRVGVVIDSRLERHGGTTGGPAAPQG